MKTAICLAAALMMPCLVVPRPAIAAPDYPGKEVRMIVVE